MPEGNTALAQAVIYLATAPKSNAVYAAYQRSLGRALKDEAEPVPLHLRNAPTRLMKELDYGKGYRYAHDEADAVAGMDCLPGRLQGRKFYRPTDRGFREGNSSAASTPGKRSRRSERRSLVVARLVAYCGAAAGGAVTATTGASSGGVAWCSVGTFRNISWRSGRMNEKR